MLTGDAGSDERMVRAFLTDGERDAVRDDPDMDQSTKSTHLSRVRGKIPKLREDAEILRRHRPEIYEQVRDAVVEEEFVNRMERLEREIAELKAEREDDS